MNHLAQVDIPINDMMIASNNLIVDQGVAVFAVIVFAMVIFGLMGLMFIMQRQTGAMLRQMGKESAQQDKLITQNNLDRVAAQRNTDELVDVKDLLARLIDAQTQGNNNKNEIINNGIQTIEKMDGSVNDMQQEFEGLKTQLVELIKMLSEGKITMSPEDQEKIVDSVTAGVSKNILAEIAKLQQTETETETPTQKIEIEKPQSEIETDEAPKVPSKLHGVPVTPKPTDEPKKEGTT